MVENGGTHEDAPRWGLRVGLRGASTGVLCCEPYFYILLKSLVRDENPFLPRTKLKIRIIAL